MEALIHKLEEKVLLLIDQNKSLKLDIQSLNTKYLNHERIIEIQKNTIKELEEKNKLLNIATTIKMDTKDKKAAKLKINEFIREIDKCITLIND